MSVGAIRAGYQAKHIATATTTHVKTTSGFLHAITVNTTAANTVTISDANGTIGILKASVAEGTYIYDVEFAGKLDIVTGGASDLTVSYN